MVIFTPGKIVPREEALAFQPGAAFRGSPGTIVKETLPSGEVAVTRAGVGGTVTTVTGAGGLITKTIERTGLPRQIGVIGKAPPSRQVIIERGLQQIRPEARIIQKDITKRIQIEPIQDVIRDIEIERRRLPIESIKEITKGIEVTLPPSRQPAMIGAAKREEFTRQFELTRTERLRLAAKKAQRIGKPGKAFLLSVREGGIGFFKGFREEPVKTIGTAAAFALLPPFITVPAFTLGGAVGLSRLKTFVTPIRAGRFAGELAPFVLLTGGIKKGFGKGGFVREGVKDIPKVFPKLLVSKRAVLKGPKRRLTKVALRKGQRFKFVEQKFTAKGEPAFPPKRVVRVEGKIITVRVKDTKVKLKPPKDIKFIGGEPVKRLVKARKRFDIIRAGLKLGKEIPQKDVIKGIKPGTILFGRREGTVARIKIILKEPKKSLVDLFREAPKVSKEPKTQLILKPPRLKKRLKPSKRLVFGLPPIRPTIKEFGRVSEGKFGISPFERIGDVLRGKKKLPFIPPPEFVPRGKPPKGFRSEKIREELLKKLEEQKAQRSEFFKIQEKEITKAKLFEDIKLTSVLGITSILGLDVTQKGALIQKEVLVLEQELEQALIQEQTLAQEQTLEQEQALAQEQALIQEQALVQEQALEQGQITRTIIGGSFVPSLVTPTTTPFITPIEIPFTTTPPPPPPRRPPPTPPPKVPPPPPPPPFIPPKPKVATKPKQLRIVTPLEPSFAVFIKRKGKFIRVSPALRKETAISLGAFITGKTLAAQFKLLPVKERPVKIRRETLLGFEKRFRAFRLVKGKKVPLPPLHFIERRPFRLETRGEVKEILVAKRKKGLINFITNKKKQIKQRQVKSRISNLLATKKSTGGKIKWL